MFEWYRELTGSQRKTFWACFGGWGLDAMDFQIYFFVIPSLIALWKMSNAAAGLIATTSLIASAVGGWIGGMLSDRFGRLRILQWTIVWYAVFTFLCGFAQSYSQLGVLRTLQGLGFGAEWAVGAVLLGEVINPKDRGKAVGCVQSAFGVGWTLAALSYGIAFSAFDPSFAWRVLFWIGLLPVVGVIFIRFYVREESSLFVRSASSEKPAGLLQRLTGIFTPPYLPRTLLASCLCLGIQGGTIGLLVWLPTFLKNSRGLSVVGTTNYSLVITIGSFFGFVAGAYLADAIGRRMNFIIWSIICTIVVAVYTAAPINDAAMLALGFPLGFAVCGVYGGIGAYLTELFPTRVRATAQSFTYNFGRGLGALVPFTIGLLSTVVPLGQAIAAFVGASYLLVLISVLLLPETRGMDLTKLDAESAQQERSRVLLNVRAKA
jgi:MFS family permease